MAYPPNEERKSVSKPIFDFDLTVPMGPRSLRFVCQSNKLILGVFGTSGAGKTTLLETIAGLRMQAKGHISCENEVWLDTQSSIFVPPQLRAIGYVPQDHLLFPHWTVRQNLQAARHGNSPTDSSTKTFEKVIEVIGLKKLLDRSTEDLSGGERQRIALGRALCSNPKLLMLDEPLASLDLHRRKRILPLIKELRDEFKIPILLVSHSTFEIQAICEEVILIQNGQSIAQGLPSSVFAEHSEQIGPTNSDLENVFEATVENHTNDATFVRLGNSSKAPKIQLESTPVAPSETITLSLRASDILIATEPPKGLSARNCINAEVTNIIHQDRGSFVQIMVIDGDLAPLSAELTCNAVKDLEINIGKKVYAIFKTTSVVSYALSGKIGD